jgi:methionine sulfoxide reductase heme-binding subunit
VTWIILRAAGIGAYLMLFGAVAWGLISTTALVAKRLVKASSILIHQVLGSVGLALLSIHLAGLLFDRFVKFDELDLLIPFRADRLRVATAIGVIAMYATVVVLISSWARRGIGPTWWRRLHLLATPAFSLALVHGMIAGTDTRHPWMWWTYVGTALAIVFLLVVRTLTGGARQPALAQAPARPTRAHRLQT